MSEHAQQIQAARQETFKKGLDAEDSRRKRATLAAKKSRALRWRRFQDQRLSEEDESSSEIEEDDDDDGDDGEELGEEIEAISRKEIEESTRDMYRTRLRHFISYLREKAPELVIDDDTFDVKGLRIKEFMAFLAKKHSDDKASYETVDAYRTAFFYALREANVSLTPSAEKKLRRFFRGLWRKDRQEKRDGLRPVKEGKEAMPHELLVWLCDYFIRDGNIFGWVYLTLAWSSMLRTNNVAAIRLEDLAALQDSLGLHVPKSKGDPYGTRAHIAWQIFANPNDFRQCPVTALAALLLMDELRSGEKLFAGSNQERRFAGQLQHALASVGGQTILEELGLKASDISPHSSRKGSASYANAGTTHPPAFHSVTLRGGWSGDDILRRYFHYDSTMDAYIGRLLAGLDVMSVNFAVLPPHFKPDRNVTDAMILRCFPAFREKAEFMPVLRFVLPSFIFHYDKLRCMLPKNHRLRVSVPAMDAQLSQTFLSNTIAGLESPYMTATGLPPHVVGWMQRTPSDAMEISEPVTILTPAFVPEPNAVVDIAFPPDFELPQVGPLTAWRLLLLGDKNRGLPPFRLLNPKDFPGKRNLRKRISDWKFLYNTIVAKVDVDVDTIVDDDQITAAFLKVWSTFGFGATKGNIRPDQWKLSTVVLKLREIAATKEKPEHA